MDEAIAPKIISTEMRRDVVVEKYGSD